MLLLHLLRVCDRVVFFKYVAEERSMRWGTVDPFFLLEKNLA
jgi:hypothetical protein